MTPPRDSTSAGDAPSHDPDASGAPSPERSENSGSASELSPPLRRLNFPVVGIGASAGGLEALEALTKQLFADRMAFVVVQHLAPGHVSLLKDILGRGTRLPVATVEHGMRLEPGRIYVAPPTVELSIDGDELRVTSTADVPRSHHTIDAFFRSLAHAGGPKSIGVVLSGSGRDGTLGLKAIKDEGGITFAQEPSTAAQPSMPQSAIDAGCADFTLTPSEIGSELMRLGEHPYVGRARPARWVDESASTRIFEQLREAYGIDFSLYKQSTIERRIARRMAVHKIDRADDYLALLGTEGAELRNLYNDLLIGVTTFFRDAEPFEALKNVVFSRVVEGRNPEIPIRIWVAGCSTGEEAYSIAIALLEYLGDRASAHKIQIFATDVDEDALVRARTAVYPASIELDVSPERLQRFFSRTDKGYQVVRQVRDLAVFARHNLGKDPPFSRLDLVTCRNVLIYMQTALQKKVLRIFHYALNQDAYLLLGTSESVGDSAELFTLLDRKLKVYGKKNTPASAVFDLSLSGRAFVDGEGSPSPADRKPIVGVANLADRKVIEKYGPPGVIVDDRLDIIQFRGRTGRFIEPSPGTATLNLLKLARTELLGALRTTVHRAMSDGLPAASPAVSMRGENGTRSVTVDVMPLPDSAGRRCLLILFSETPVAPTPEAPSDDGVVDTNPRVTELERELASSKENLQSTVEELEAANEELQSSNEELQSSNEELQSTNEELETSKEELQSTNEELATVNDELSDRMEELSVSNDDLQNVLVATAAAIVIVGADQRIRRFSAPAEKLLGLVPGDAGRPVAYLRNVLSASDIDQSVAEVISTVTASEQRVRCIDGFWYTMRMAPYVTADRAIRGVLMEFTRKNQPAATNEGPVHPLAQQALSAVPMPLMIIDRQLNLVWANRTFFETFSVGPSALGRPLSEPWGSLSEPTELWVFLEDLVSGRSPRDVMIDRLFGRTAERPMRFSGRPVPAEGERPTLAVVLMQDV